MKITVALALLLGGAPADVAFAIGNFEVLNSDTMAVDRASANKCCAMT